MAMPATLWKEIPGYPKYQINRKGMVRSVTGHAIKRYNRRYRLIRDGKHEEITVKELLGLAFPPDSPSGAPSVNPPPCTAKPAEIKESVTPASQAAQAVAPEAVDSKPKRRHRVRPCYAGCWCATRGFLCAKDGGQPCDSALISEARS
jgi:hypothetical protein